ncbi:MAG: putative NUDIX hydrolase [Syntrophorhabdus sp. PtaU1.Bin002]|nr:MAG: putative NUDIX hydrolase [Syntrophorhabdus sp. PtaB.Bin006]OPY74125.1 MAG: putative NUDIX hydrolase [Syntrophorhabdus sp. PtaU1.Bin002]
MISRIRQRLKTYKPQDIYCVRSKWAGVLVPLLEMDGKPFVVLTKRTHTVRAHKGEVSFPGGMYEEDDGDRKNTAIRECHEEIGIRVNDMEIIGRLDDMYTLTGYCMRPYVGIVPFPYPFRTNPDEVAYLIYLPFDFLRQVEPVPEEAEYRGYVEKVPSFYYEGDRIWGATCRILLRLRRMM